ncbi:MAG TPA: hypothetical protein VKA84_01015, partial [Gemmatimonadaceae bacterium]|nr:hypothetical protein [Gemmatimonadaceae bacterium]
GTEGTAPARGATAARAVGFGLGTGVLIAAYTLWDKHAVGPLGISPVLMEWATSAARVVLLAPVAARRPDEVRALWRTRRRDALWIGALNPLSYLLVLWALQFSPVSYVAPAREVSILLGAAMGARLLNEGQARRRLLAAAAILLGVVALASG